jgi:hypothetical protein
MAPVIYAAPVLNRIIYWITERCSGLIERSSKVTCSNISVVRSLFVRKSGVPLFATIPIS